MQRSVIREARGVELPDYTSLHPGYSFLITSTLLTLLFFIIQCIVKTVFLGIKIMRYVAILSVLMGVSISSLGTMQPMMDNNNPLVHNRWRQVAPQTFQETELRIQINQLKI